MIPLSETGKKMLSFQEQLAKEFKYQPIGISIFYGDVRETFKAALPDWCKVEGDPNARLYTLDGTLIGYGYKRVVIGDYGAFIEISPGQIVPWHIKCKEGQEYRINDPRFAANIKYQWLTARDHSNCKIYKQIKTVEYADYLPEMYYISPYELACGQEGKTR
jgi:hypothetical protein